MSGKTFSDLGFKPGEVVRCVGVKSSGAIGYAPGEMFVLKDGGPWGPVIRRRGITWLGDAGEWAFVEGIGEDKPVAQEVEDDEALSVASGTVTSAEDAPVFHFEVFDSGVRISDIKTDIASEAVRIVSGARRSAYGTPENNFERIARFWQAYMQNTGRDIEITAADVSPLMRLMKEARLCETPDHRDSHVDLIGYAMTGAEVAGVKRSTQDTGE